MEVNFNRRTIISFPDNADLPDIGSDESTQGKIADGSLSIDEVLFPDRFTIGTYTANRFEVELYDFPTIGAEKIYVYQIVDEVEGEEPIEVPLFTGYVDSCTTNRGRFEDSKRIVAYDALYSKGKVDVSAWWEEVFDTETQVSVKTLRESILDFVELDYDSVDLPNDTVLIKQTQQLNNISFEAMFKYILELNATNANVTRDGRVQFLTVSSEESIDVEDVYAQNTSEFDTYTIPAYGAVRITLSSRNVVATVGESNFLDITDNLLLLNKSKTALTPIAQAILDSISTFTYKSASIDMIWNQLDIKVGDKLLIDDNTYLVCENFMSGSMLVDQQISSNGGEQIEDTSAEYDASKVDMQAQIEASSLKYYRYQNIKAFEFSATRQILSIRYTSVEDGVIIFHGCVIFDVERIDTSKPASVEIQYSINNTIVREYTPTETYYHDGRHTINLLHFWESQANKIEKFVVFMIPTNCKITIGAFRLEGYMEGMGLVGDATWDGIIDIEDEFTPVEITTTPQVITTIVPQLDTSTVTPYDAESDDTFAPITLNTTPTLLPYNASLYLNRQIVRDFTWGEILQNTWQELYDGYLW